MAEAKNKDSVRKKVIVTRKFGDGEDTNKIFVGARIIKNGVAKMEQFRVPVETEIELPIEVIAQLKDRGVPKEKGGKLSIAKEFSVETV